MGIHTLANWTASAEWFWASAAALAMVGLMRRRAVGRTAWRVAAMVSLTTLGGASIARWWGTSCGFAQDVALMCGALAFFWSVVAAVDLLRRRNSSSSTEVGVGWFSLASCAVLLLCVVTVVIQAVVLAMRVIYVGFDLANGSPVDRSGAYGFGAQGLWSLGFLLAACSVSFGASGDRRLGSCQLWCLVVFVLWGTLLPPVFVQNATGAWERTASTLLVLIGLAVVLPLMAWMTNRVERRSRWWRLLSNPHNVAAVSCYWPGLSISAVIVAIVVTLLAGFHLAVPTPIGSGGFPFNAAVVTGATGLSAVACFAFLKKSWNRSLADAAMGLSSLCLCAFPTLAIPFDRFGLAHRYPMIFNAMMIGLTVGTACWAWCAADWQLRRTTGSVWSTAAKLASHAQRFAFLTGSLALLVGLSMAIWPRWPSVGEMDHSLARVSDGMAANLLLLLVLLWCSRRLRASAFHVLTMLSLALTTGFLLVRVLPFGPQFG